MTPPVFDPARYPRTYTASTRWRAFAWLVGGGLAAGGLAAIVHTLLLDPVRDAARGQSLCIAFAAMAVLGLALLVSVLRVRIVIGADFIEARCFRTWRLRRTDIVDFHTRLHEGIREFRLRSTLRRRPFKFTQVFRADEAFTAWFAALVDSDRARNDDILAGFARDDRLGATPALRLAHAGQSRRIARWLSWIAFGLGVWAIARPQPFGLATALLAAFPVLAIALVWRSHGTFSLVWSRTSPRADLSPLILAPSALLALTWLLGGRLVDPWALAPAATAIGVLLTALAVAACTELRASPFNAIVTALMLVLYAGGTLALADVHFDGKAARSTPVTVAALRHTRGKGAMAYFTLRGLPTRGADTDMRVADDLYRRTALGDRVCFLEHPGALGWRWTDVEAAAACTPR